MSTGERPADPTTPKPPAADGSTLVASCPSCGAPTSYAPGTEVVRCAACGTEQQIAAATVAVREHSYDQWRAKHGDLEVAGLGAQVLRCRGCGATTESTDLAATCQFCGGSLVAEEHPAGVVVPEAVLPFGVDAQAARTAFRSWVGSRRLAPSALKRVGQTEGLRGTYVPHWTFDAHTETDYEGKRGDHYHVTVSHQVSDGKGGHRTEQRQERRTRWRRASGHVSRDFDDVLVAATGRLDAERLDKMGPWKLEEATPFRPEYLSGFSALRYDVDPQEGAKRARATMRTHVEDDCERDIGGDEQRVSDMDVTYSHATFKLLLMPLWIATYLYGGRTWQVMVNANTGEVVGERPWSRAKIAALVVLALLVVGAVVWAVLAGREGAGATGTGGPP